MALVDSDLFLVQDATTKTNYKITYANLAADISLDSDYVNVTGDNMTGNLTFDTDKIVLDADGSATFAGVVECDAGFISTRTDNAQTVFLGKHNNSNKIIMYADGDASFVGDVTANKYYGDGSELTGIDKNLQAVTDAGNTTTLGIELGGNLECDNVIAAGGGSFGSTVSATNVFVGDTAIRMYSNGAITGGSLTVTGEIEGALIDCGEY